jgi:hypothetical protein
MECGKGVPGEIRLEFRSLFLFGPEFPSPIHRLPVCELLSAGGWFEGTIVQQVIAISDRSKSILKVRSTKQTPGFDQHLESERGLVREAPDLAHSRLLPYAKAELGQIVAGRRESITGRRFRQFSF